MSSLTLLLINLFAINLLLLSGNLFTQTFTTEARDNFGLINISASRETNAPEIKLNTAYLMIGYVFKFGQRI